MSGFPGDVVDRIRAERARVAVLETELLHARTRADAADQLRAEVERLTKAEAYILADDEIVVKRTKADYFGATSDNWRVEANEVARLNPAAADLCRSYADALDAEAGDQS